MTIEERARHKAELSQFRSDYIYDRHSVKVGYIDGATEQKAIDEANYKDIIAEESNASRESGIAEGRRDIIDKVTKWLENDTDTNCPIGYWRSCR